MPVNEAPIARSPEKWASIRAELLVSVAIGCEEVQPVDIAGDAEANEDSSSER